MAVHSCRRSALKLWVSPQAYSKHETCKGFWHAPCSHRSLDATRKESSSIRGWGDYRYLKKKGFPNIVYQWLQVADKVDEDLYIRLMIEVVNGSHTGEKTIRATFLSLFLGSSERLLSIMNTSLPELGLQSSDCTEMSWIESVLFSAGFAIGTPVEALLDRKRCVLNHFKRKSNYLKEPITKVGLEGLWKKMIELQTPFLKFNPYGGKMAEISPTATPFPHRAGNLCKIQYGTDWDEEGSEAAERYINLTGELHSYMTPFVSNSPREAYLNYRDLDLGINHNGKNSYLEGRVYGMKYFKKNFERLVHIKTKVVFVFDFLLKAN